MRLDIYSDTICPWCFVGKRRLERALAMRPATDLTIQWRAFQLNPGMPAEGMARSEYLEVKFGGPERASRIYEAVRMAGESEGIRSEEHTSELQSLMCISYAVFRLKKKQEHIT